MADLTTELINTIEQITDPRVRVERVVETLRTIAMGVDQREALVTCGSEAARTLAPADRAAALHALIVARDHVAGLPPSLND